MRRWEHLNLLMEILGDEDRRLLQQWLADDALPLSDELYFAAAITGRMVLELKAEAKRLENLHVRAIVELNQTRDAVLVDISQSASRLTRSIENATSSQREGVSELGRTLTSVVRTASSEGSSAALIVGANRVFEAMLNRLQERTTWIALLIAVTLIAGAFFVGLAYGATGAQTILHAHSSARR